MLPKLPDQYLFQTSRSGRGEVDRTKNIIIKYCPAKANENLLNAALLIYMLAKPDWNLIAKWRIIFCSCYSEFGKEDEGK